LLIQREQPTLLSHIQTQNYLIGHKQLVSDAPHLALAPPLQPMCKPSELAI
jgi:hypothetical protein